jgi:hypothetical protein
MIVSATPFMERRDDIRVGTESQVRMQAPNAIFPQSGPAVIEEISACGLRLKSQVRPHRDEELTLKVAGLPAPLHARVIWVEQGPPARHGSHKTWIAGCLLLAESIGNLRLPLKQPKRTFWSILSGRNALRLAIAIGILALLVYLYVFLARFVGGGTQLISIN